MHAVFCIAILFPSFQLGPLRAGWLPGIKDASKRLYSRILLFKAGKAPFIRSRQAGLLKDRRCRKLSFKGETKREAVIVETEESERNTNAS